MWTWTTILLCPKQVKMKQWIKSIFFDVRVFFEIPGSIKIWIRVGIFPIGMFEVMGKGYLVVYRF
ncbi:hypothetical protein CAY53_06865 [Desulfobulbus oralis]|uniref:Uncharacterized protein n=1 Tax=Desulfobulbus oralis TaxID=1986146 RepID=A0A2L1GNK3_9BACT|nr:hypothetical protein CAY53_06865 [Desulfobulbus oralis]